MNVRLLMNIPQTLLTSNPCTELRNLIALLYYSAVKFYAKEIFSAYVNTSKNITKTNHKPVSLQLLISQWSTYRC